MCQGTGLANRFKHDQLISFLQGKKKQSKKTKPVSNVQKIRYGLKHHVLLFSVSVPLPQIKARGNTDRMGDTTPVVEE